MLISKRIKDLTGKVVGDWTVISFSHLNKYNSAMWLCKCKCGTKKIQHSNRINKNLISNCGCETGWKISKSKLKDISGQKFGRLTAISIHHVEPKKGSVWNFKCDCGNECQIPASYVVHSNTKSCGCFKKEVTIARNKEIMRKKDNGSNRNGHYNHYKICAKNRGLSFELTKEEFEEMTFTRCYYCNSEPDRKFRLNRYSGELYCNGVDRLNSDLGYFKENCVPCCKTCNFMKMTLTEEVFYTHIKKIYEFQMKKEESNIIKYQGVI